MNVSFELARHRASQQQSIERQKQREKELKLQFKSAQAKEFARLSAQAVKQGRKTSRPKNKGRKTEEVQKHIYCEKKTGLRDETAQHQHKSQKKSHLQLDFLTGPVHPLPTGIKPISDGSEDALAAFFNKPAQCDASLDFEGNIEEMNSKK